MSDYAKATNFTTKDTLPTGNSGKIVKGTELDVEFTAIASAIASKANADSPTFTGTPSVPTAVAGTNTTQIASCAFVLTNGIPSGCIVMWSGSIATIPSGWYLCNGSNGTPDLRNKFIIGADTDVSSVSNTSITGANTKTGGTKDAIVVSHSHSATSTTTASDSGHQHFLSTPGGQGSVNAGNNLVGNYNEGTQTYAKYTGFASANISASTSTTVNSTGSDGTNQNLPPYYALAFIMKG